MLEKKVFLRVLYILLLLMHLQRKSYFQNMAIGWILIETGQIIITPPIY